MQSLNSIRGRTLSCFILLIMAALLANIVSFITRLLNSDRRSSLLSVRHPSSKYKLPYPRIPHLILEDELISGRHIFIIGDVHGCLEELEELLQKAKSLRPEGQVLPLFVGDLLSKGPYPVETVRKLQQMEHFAVRGNHDEAVLKQALSLKKDPNYELPSKYAWVRNLSNEDIAYLQELPYTISVPSLNVIIVHAGLVPGISLKEQDLTNMIIMRNLEVMSDGILKPAELTDEGEAWASFWPGPEHVYFGHDARRKLQQHKHATGLDTGCVYGHELTGALVTKESREFLNVQAKEVYKGT